MEFAHHGTDLTPAWERWERENVAVDGNRVRIAPAPSPAYRTIDAVHARSGARFIDLAIDECGEVFLLAADGGIYRYTPGGRCDPVRLDCPADVLADPRAIAVTRHSIYIASGSPGRVSAYARHAGGVRWVASTDISDPVAFVRLDGAVHLLDRGERSGRGAVHRFTSAGDVEPVVTGLVDPIDLGADEDGALYILEPYAWGEPPDRYTVRKLPAQAVAHPPTPGVDTVWIPPEGFRSIGSGDPVVPACLATGLADELLVGTARGTDGEDAVFGFRATNAAFAHQTDVPAGCAALAIDRSGTSARLYAIDGDGSLFVGDGTTERRPNPATGTHDGRVRTCLDAGVTGTQWHRVRVDQDRPDANTQLTVRYHATDAPVAADGSTTDITTDLTAVTGIGHRKAWRLRRAGVTDLASLAGSEPETVAAIVSVEEISVPAAQVREWQTEAESLLVDGEDDLRAVNGIGPVFAPRLRAAGIETLTDFVDATPTAISALLGSRLRTISTDRTASWIAHARSLLPDDAPPDEPDWEATPPNPDEALLSDAVGRYLWVEIELVGTAEATPTVETIDVSTPRRSYLEDLPAVYRSDEATSDFLEPFLALFESVLTEVDESIADLPGYLDPDGIPATADQLEWLGGWLAADLDAGWPDAAKRAFTAAAPTLYRMRGTRRGLEATIDLYLDHVDVDRAAWDEVHAVGDGEAEVALVRVFEHAELACASGAALEPYSRLISCPHGFLVLLHPALSQRHADAIGRIVGHQRPAHTSGRAVALRPVTLLTGRGEHGYHSYLGVNTVLSDRAFTVEHSSLGQETALPEREPHGALGIRARLGEDVRLS